MNSDELETAATLSEAERVMLKRYAEARAAGLTTVEAGRFARSSVDVGVLRHLVKAKCPPATMARILL